MAGFEFFERELKLAAGLEPAAIAATLARFAREEVGRAIAEGASPIYEKLVNGRRGAAEETVVPPGPIVYVFNNWPLVIDFTLDELRKRAPRRTGRFVNSFIVLANQQPVTDYTRIEYSAEVVITNRMPYVRRIEVGANRSKGKRMFDRTKAVVNRRFKEAFRAETKFLDIGSGVAPGVPYILKHSQGNRRDRQAGQPISYPAIVLNVA